MTPHPSIDLALLGRYLDSTASAEEQAAVEAWIGAAPERRAAVEALQASWTADARRLDAPYDAEAGWAELTARLGAPRRRGVRLPAASPWRRVGWAAAILVATGAGVQWWRATRVEPSPPVAQAPAMREYATPRGHRAVFRLLDGTEIMLNADSRIRAPVGFGAAGRGVYLDGEAYFSVVHDDARPFVVHTARGAIRDLGTRFGVRAYPDAMVERVAVAEGSVAVAAAGQPGAGETPLAAGQVATLTAAGKVSVLRRASVSDELAWTSGRLVFRSVPLAEAARRIGRWYDLDIRITDARLAGRPVTGSYSDEPFTEVLTLITAAVGARYEWRGRTVTISTAEGAR